MGKTILFLAQNKYSPSVDEQKINCADPDDRIVYAGDVQFTNLLKNAARHRQVLTKGDHLKLYDLNSFILTSGSMIRMLVKLLRAGITITICSEGITIHPDENDPMFRILVLLDEQQRAVHAVRTHGPQVKTGRKPRLHPEQWPDIHARLAAPDATLASVAQSLGVGRTTLFNFTRRMQSAV